MRICFSGLEKPIEVDQLAISVLEISNRVLFARVCESLSSGLSDDAVEPYSLWDGDKELRASGQLVYIGDPLNLPWEDRAFAGALAGRVEDLAYEDDSIRSEFEELYSAIASRISSLALQLDSDYAFKESWELKKYIKCFGFGVDIVPGDPLIDKLIKFAHLAKDVSLRKALVFVNLKLFLSSDELKSFYEQVFFSNLSVLLIENAIDAISLDGERKYTIDQDFLEVWPNNPADMPVSLQ